MAELGRYRVPKEFKDEDKWFRFFTKRQLIYLGLALVVSVITCIGTYKLNILPVGVVVSELLIMVAAAFAFITIPPEKYMYGGGYRLSTILFRIVVRRLPKNRVLFVKNYDNDNGE